MALRNVELPACPTLDFEQALWNAGVRLVAGIDEAGRGPLAGPVAAAAVLLPNETWIIEKLHGVRDSKQMSPAAREAARLRITEHAAACGVGFASAQEIDVMGIVPATHLAAKRALEQLVCVPEHLLLDCLFLRETPTPQTSLIKGDRRSLSIAAASILAKTARDALMLELDEQYPGYGFAAHKGYGTAAHRQAIRRMGPSPIHRRSFTLLRENS
jgi:ribonuclease HII